MAIVFQVGSITEMAQIIKSLANDRPRLARMGQKAHTTIRAHLSYEQYASWFDCTGALGRRLQERVTFLGQMSGSNQ